MKRKIAILLTLALSVTLLGGCGESTQTATSSGTTNNNSGGIFTSSKSSTLSEYLSKEKVIAYEVDTVDKSETPDNIYFFEDGTLTIIPGGQFGLTMGDFAQMEDKEIWSTYETVRATYVENYKNRKVSEATDSLNAIIQSTQSFIDEMQEQVTELTNRTDTGDILSYMLKMTEGSGCAWAWYVEGKLDIYDEIYDKCEDGEITIQEGKNFFTDGAEDVISEYTTKLTQRQAELDGISTSTCAIPFCDMPFAFVIETDSTGNNVANEKLVFPTLSYSILDDAPSTYYDYIEFANVEGADRQIYDTTYNCLWFEGGKLFCTRASMELDTVDSKNVLIDLSEDEINELFKDEVMARYE